MKLIRKISLAKWANSIDKNADGFSADAITGCLRTSENTLSVWRDGDDGSGDKSLLALLASQTRIDKLDLIRLNQSEVESRNLLLVATPGNTAAEKYSNNHLDISNLDLDSLRSVAELVKQEVLNERSERISKAKFIELLLKGIEDGDVNEKALSAEVIKELEKARAKPN